MSTQVVNGAVLRCSYGAAPCILSVSNARQSAASNQPLATVRDHQPRVNIAGFGLCTAPANPDVAAANADPQRAVTPVPCVPVIRAPWSPGSPAVRIGGQPALNTNSTCACSWGGVISVAHPGQASVQIP